MTSVSDSPAGNAPGSTDTKNKIGKLAAVLCFAIAIGGALAEIGLAWVWLFPEYVEKFVVPHVGLAGTAVDLSAGTRLFGFLVSMVPLSVLFYASHQAYELLKRYLLGDLFAPDAPLRLRRIGLSMLALAVIRPATGAVLSALLTASNGAGEKQLVIGISLDDYMIAVFGGLILAIGHVMVEAQRLADESKEII